MSDTEPVSEEAVGETKYELVMCSGVEGPNLSFWKIGGVGGTRFAGPKSWGGGQVLHKWRITPADLVRAMPELALEEELKQLRADEYLVNLRRELVEAQSRAVDGWKTQREELKKLREQNEQLRAIAGLVPALQEALTAAVGDFDAPCPHCQGKGKIPGSRNWVSQGYVEADCFHCGATGKRHNLDWFAAAQTAIADAIKAQEQVE